MFYEYGPRSHTPNIKPHSSCVARPTDIPYGDKDQDGEYTLLSGDIVEFSVATDRRDKLQRATNISLLHETFEKTTERRETVRMPVLQLMS